MKSEDKVQVGSVEEVYSLIRLCEFVVQTGNADIHPDLKYSLIFTEGVSERILDRFDLRAMYGYRDPDTTYQDDVRAFVQAVDRLLIDLRKTV